MDEMLPFLRAIAANPDDDTPRLVFSDWLEEHDHHERAEFIRLQIELARMDESDEGYAEKTARIRRCGVFTRLGKVPFFDHLPSEKCKIAFHRGFIASIDATNAETIDTSGFDLIPLRSLRAGDELIEQFKGFAKLKRLDFDKWDLAPAKLLEVLGPDGWFKDLEELSLSRLNTDCLAAGVIPQFDLPRLRNFLITTQPFYDLGVGTDCSRTATFPNSFPCSAIPISRRSWVEDGRNSNVSASPRGPTSFRIWRNSPNRIAVRT